MHIRKVKSTNGLILIRAEETSGRAGGTEDDVRRIELESRAKPRPEFHEAMGGLILPALDMIQAPFAWKAVATISGLSLTHEEERGIGAVVTLLVPLECAPSPLVINTPYLTSVDPNESGAPLLPTDLCQAVIRVVDEALRYLNGDRAQGDLFERGILEFDDPDIVDRILSERAAEKLEAYGVVEPWEPAHIVAGKLMEGGATLAEAMNEQSAAESESLSDGPVRAEFEPGAIAPGIRAEAMHKQSGIKPARGRRAAKT